MHIHHVQSTRYSCIVDNRILFKASEMKVVNKQPLGTPSERRYTKQTIDKMGTQIQEECLWEGRKEACHKMTHPGENINGPCNEIKSVDSYLHQEWWEGLPQHASLTFSVHPASHTPASQSWPSPSWYRCYEGVLLVCPVLVGKICNFYSVSFLLAVLCTVVTLNTGVHVYVILSRELDGEYKQNSASGS